jgi:gentisate 1,2-dioxygenase
MSDAAAIKSPEKQAYLEEIAGHDLAPLWEIYENLVMDEPNRAEPPMIWRWSEMAALVEKSAELVQGKEADHRVLIMKNPHLAPRMATTTNILAAYQCVMPGERTSPHRHTPAATRVILEGAGGGTFVDGKRCDMFDGDLIITPNWTWHNHDNDSGKRAVWLDILDIPLVGGFDAVFGDMGPVDAFPENISTLPDKLFGAGGILPQVEAGEVRHSPRLRYAWEDVVAAVEATPEADDGTKTLNYLNPVDGGPMLPTLDSRALSLSGGAASRQTREMANMVCIVLEGEGTSRIGEEEVSWSAKDVFTVPHWTWFSHTAASNRALMIQISDREIMRKLNLYRAEAA